MAKKIRSVKKIRQEDISKNTGKEISSTIARFKMHEKRYTFYLVVIFMLTIMISAYFGLKVDTYSLYDSTSNDKGSYLSFSSRLVFLNQKNIMNDVEGLQSNSYLVDFSNTTAETINYIIRLVLDEDSIEQCNCVNEIVEYDKIRYSVDGENVLSFQDDSMVVETGTLHSQKSEKINIRFWLNDQVDASKCHFYGRLVFEELGDIS